MALILFTGGARSGKSAAAQDLAASRALNGSAVCVAVFGRLSGEDSEFSARIERHRLDRPDSWTTIEATDSLGWSNNVPADSLLLVDCMGTLLGLAMEEAYALTTPAEEESPARTLGDASANALPPGFDAEVRERMDRAISAILSRRGDTVVVTNEVGDGVVPSHATGRLFRDMLGHANRRLAAASDSAYLCVAGRLVDLTGLPHAARWPDD